MAALTGDRITTWRYQDELEMPVAAATKIYYGSMVCANAAGFAVPAADTAAFVVMGVATEQIDNLSGANGDKMIRLREGRVHTFDATSITQAMVGKAMYVVDDHTFDDGVGTNSIKAGTLTKFISATEGEIQIHTGLR